MSPLPDVIITVLAPFAGLFSATVWGHAQVLVIGAILCQGPRTVAAILRVMGLGQEPRFERYHRVLSRARWSGLQAAKQDFGTSADANEGVLFPKAAWDAVLDQLAATV